MTNSDYYYILRLIEFKSSLRVIIRDLFYFNRLYLAEIIIISFLLAIIL